MMDLSNLSERAVLSIEEEMDTVESVPHFVTCTARFIFCMNGSIELS